MCARLCLIAFPLVVACTPAPEAFVAQTRDAGVVTEPEPVTGDAGRVDRDGGGPDGGVVDAGVLDAGPVDGGASDAGPLDGGVTDADGGDVDAGPLDGGFDADGGADDAGPDVGGDGGLLLPDAGGPAFGSSCAAGDGYRFVEGVCIEQPAGDGGACLAARIVRSDVACRVPDDGTCEGLTAPVFETVAPNGAACGVGCTCVDGAQQEVSCDDGEDNDEDNDADCDDTDCRNRSCGVGCHCPFDGGPPVEVRCTVGSPDEDGDGQANCDDTDCLEQDCDIASVCRSPGDVGDCYPVAETSCIPSSGDEDGDELANCLDPDCDGLGCGVGCRCEDFQRHEDSCDDGLDNDDDMRVDCDDRSCEGKPCHPDPGVTSVCAGKLCVAAFP